MTTQAERRRDAAELFLRDIGVAFVFVWLPILGAAGLRYRYELSSFAPGVAAICVALIGAAIIRVVPAPSSAATQRRMALTVALCGLIAIHAAIAQAFADASLYRPLSSLAALALIMLAAIVIERNLFGRQDRSIDQIMLMTFALFVLVAINGLVGVQPYSLFATEKALFPFTEPSHFALAIAPIAVFLAVRGGLYQRYIVLAVAFAMALLLRNLSLLVVVAVAGAVSLRTWQLLLFLLAGALLVSLVDLEYFSDRVDFSYASTNLSTLVYIQGTELIQRAIETTYGWGIGFQQLGFTDLYTPTSDVIYRLTQDDLNLRDGGFTAAKLTAEFGLFGVALLIFYLYRLIGVVLEMRKASLNPSAAEAGRLLALAAFTAYSVELFVRGAGYFTPSTVLFVAALPIALRRPAGTRPRRPILFRAVRG